MAIDVKDLPPKYQAQALQKYMAQQARRGPPPSPAADRPQKASKYHNSPTERVTPSGAVLHFDSQKEARRYDYLAALERAGQIRDLRLQVDFTLQEAYTDAEGRRVRAIRYRADFTYYRPPDNSPYMTYLSTPFKNAVFRRNEMSFFAGQHAGVYSLDYRTTCRLEARQVLIYQCILDLTGENDKYNHSKAAHLYPPFSYIPRSAKNYKIEPALTILDSRTEGVLAAGGGGREKPSHADKGIFVKAENAKGQTGN